MNHDACGCIPVFLEVQRVFWFWITKSSVDNVTKAETVLNSVYQEMAQHYNTYFLGLSFAEINKNPAS
jgi:hypothetical protein